MDKLNSKTVLSVLLVILITTFLLRFIMLGQAVYGDGIYYFAYTRSLVKDYDLHFENELEHRYGPDTNNTNKMLDPSEFLPDTPTNHVSNKYPVGPGLFWVPIFSIAEISANIINLFYKDFPNNGYSNIYQVTVGLFNVFAAFLGLVFLYKTLVHFFDKTISILTIIATSLGTNLFYYTALDVINSHPLSFLFGSIYFYIVFKKNNSDKALILGFLSGILALLRTQDIIFIFFTFVYIFFQNLPYRNRLINILLSGSIFSVVFLIQMLSWKIIYGSYLALPYISGEEGFYFLTPHLLEVLFGLKVGLFIWTPFYLLSAVGLFMAFKKIPKIIPLFIIIQIYIISSWTGWSQGESFGIRMIISILPLFCIGFAHLIQKLKLKYSVSLIALLIIFNFSAIFYFLVFSQNPTVDRGKNTQERVFEEINKLFR